MLPSRFLLPGLALFLVFVAYAPALSCGFVWDDFALVVGDPFIRSWRSIPDGWNQRLFFDLNGSDFFRPLQRLSYTADYALFELAPWGYHLGNILIHVGAMLAFVWAARPLVRIWRENAPPCPYSEAFLCWGPALLWALHPLHVSAITYVAGRADPLAALFGWLAVGAAARSARAGNGWLPLAAAACLAAAWSKEIGLLSFLICTLVLGTFRSDRKSLVLWAMLGVLALAAYAGSRGALEGESPGGSAVVPWIERPRLILEALAEYARLALLPIGLHMDRSGPGRLPSDGLGAFSWLHATAGLVLVSVWLAALWRNWSDSVVRTSLLAAALIYLPISNLLTLNASVAEHWLYQPMPWLLLGLFLLITRHAAGFSVAARRAGGVVFAAVLVALGVLTFLRQSEWRSYESFLRATIAAGGDSARMYGNLARLRASADPAEARQLYEEARKRSPDLVITRLGLAGLELRARDLPAARRLLEELNPPPLYRPAWWLLRAEVARQEGRSDGLTEVREALKLRPMEWRIRRYEIERLKAVGRSPEALERLIDFCERAPFRAEAWLALAVFANEVGRPKLGVYAWDMARKRDVHLKARLTSGVPTTSIE